MRDAALSIDQVFPSVAARWSMITRQGPGCQKSGQGERLRELAKLAIGWSYGDNLFASLVGQIGFFQSDLVRIPQVRE